MKLQRFERVLADGKTPDGFSYHFWCPGCNELHVFNVGRERRPVWNFDGNMECPTFSPSLLYPEKQVRCHLFVQAGKIVYCSDCGHSLAGKTVDLPDLPQDHVF